MKLRFRQPVRIAQLGAPDRAGSAGHEYAGFRCHFAGRPAPAFARWSKSANFRVCSSATLLAELLDVLSRDKFAKRLTAAGSSAQGTVAELRRLAYMVAPVTVPRVVAQDADDDHVLACALAGQVSMIVSGDRHLLSLGGYYQGIPIVTAAQAVQRINGIGSGQAP